MNKMTGTFMGPKTLENYKYSIEKCRRVMANCSTYMIFDDHEVTDDWNLDKYMEESILGNNLSRQIISNSLIAYFLFQAWGNDPDTFDDGFVGEISNHLNNTRLLKGLPNTRARYVYGIVLSRYWSFVSASNPKALCVDTRTLREFPHVDLQEKWKMRESDWALLATSGLAQLATASDIIDKKLIDFTGEYDIKQIYDALYNPRKRTRDKSAILSGEKHWPRLKTIIDKSGLVKGDVLLIVLATPFVGHQFHIRAQEAKFDYPSQRYEGDYEFYDNNPGQRVVLIDWLRRTLEPSAIVIFSGDVHYSSVIRGGYVHSDSEQNMKFGNYNWKLPIIQITSSAIKNSNKNILYVGSNPFINFLAEKRAPEEVAQFSTKRGGYLVAGFKTVDLKGDLGIIYTSPFFEEIRKKGQYLGFLKNMGDILAKNYRDTYIPNNNMCVVTMPTKSNNIVKSLFIGINGFKENRKEYVTQGVSINISGSDVFEAVDQYRRKMPMFQF
jgi:hypothetical protein